MHFTTSTGQRDYTSVSPAERALSAYTVDASGCWIPRQRPQDRGYVQISVGHRGRVYAHRAVWEYVWGKKIPDGFQMDHLCRNRACMRPDHLEPVTPRENVLRAPDTTPAINLAKTECKHGHEFSEQNTRITPLGHRQCKTCDRQRHQKASAAA